MLEILRGHGTLLVTCAQALDTGDDAALGQIEIASHEHVTRIMGKLQSAFLTPLDSEDIRTIAASLHRVVRLQRKLALDLRSAQESGVRIPAAEMVRLNTEAALHLAEAVHQLPASSLLEATQAAYRSVRSAKRLLRAWRGTSIRSASVIQLLGNEKYRTTPTALFVQYGSTLRTLERIRFKNS